MKPRSVLACAAVLLLALVAVVILQGSRAASPESVRAAAVAGGFYPADSKALTAMMDDMLARAAVPKITDPILAVVAPHAGYQYSGPVAAYTYAALKGRKFSRVVVIAPSHFEAFDFTSVYDGDAYATPLGTVPVDKAFAQQLAKMDPSIKLSSHGHTPTPQGGEHALEVELPWLQHVLGNFKLVPVVMGDQSYESSRALGVALAKLIQGGDTLIVASSDLSHYHTYDEAVRIDHKTLTALQEWDYLSMSRNFEMRVWEACGGAPIVAAMIAAERMGANKAELLKYANSGDITGDKSRVVGYSSVLLVKTQGAHDGVEQPFSLSSHDKTELLTLARKSVEHAVRTGKVYEAAASTSGTLNQERGAFVTLTEAGQLRGCVGYVSASKPLDMTVRDTATLAALRDTRFRPVAPSELGSAGVRDLGAVAAAARARHPADQGRGRWSAHEEWQLRRCLAASGGDQEGWDRQKFLEETCAKAGMQANCWKDENTDIFMFTAVIFGGAKAPTPEPRPPPGLSLRPGQQVPGSPPQ